MVAGIRCRIFVARAMIDVEGLLDGGGGSARVLNARRTVNFSNYSGVFKYVTFRLVYTYHCI